MYRWINSLKEEGTRLCRQPSSDRCPRNLLSRAVFRIVRFVENNPRATRKKLVKDLQTADIEVALQTVSNALRKHGLRS